VSDSKYIMATFGEGVICSQTNDFDPLAPCTHEEADTRLLLHVHNAVKAGYKRIAIRTVDTDVLVIAVSCWHSLQCVELWLAFGTGKHFRFIPVHEIANALGPRKSRALPAFHALTGCDTTSAFHGKGKKTAWETWSNFPDVTDAFIEVVEHTPELTDDSLSAIERFVILMYDRTSDHTNVNCARQVLFTRKSSQICKIPPTKDALHQHIKRAAYQSGHVWGQTLLLAPVLPSPKDYGWLNTSNVWHPLWITLPEADKCCLELLCCGCKTGCITKRCKCNRAGLKCTALCGCEGECARDD